MAAARVSSSQSGDSSLAPEDYSLYNQLSDEELIQIAIERSLTDTPSSTDGRSSAAPAGQSNSHAHLSGRDFGRHVRNPRSTGACSHNPPPCTTSPPPCTNPTSPNYCSHNPPVEKPPDLESFEGTVSHFVTGYGRRMVAYRKQDGNLIHVAADSEEDKDPLFSAIMNGDAKMVRALVVRPETNLLTSRKSGWLAVHEAALYGQEACLNILLSAQPGIIDKRTGKDESPLLLAVINSHVGCVSLLLQRGANTELMNKDRVTPLYKACEKDNAEVVALLLNYGAAVNTHCNQGWTALQEAVYHNNVEICEMLVKAGAKLSPSNIYGISPLFTAAQSGQVATLRLLLKHGADINSQAADGATALYEATKNGHRDVVELLLSQQADANKPGKKGLLALHVAAQHGDDILVSMLIRATSKVRVWRSGISPLHLAAEHDMDDVLELLIEAGFDVNAQLSPERSKLYEDNRSTPLYFAVFNNNIEAVSMLLEAGANPNLDIFNPLLVAVRMGCVEIVTLLVEHGANVNTYLPSHPTTFPASIMFAMKYLSMLKYILDCGCDALSCFNCTYGSSPHPPLKLNLHQQDGLRYSERGMSETSSIQCVQFCEMVSIPSMQRWAGPIIDVLLDYVGDVKLCSQLQEHLDSYPDWHSIKDKATPPRPLLQLCRLRIRQLVGLHRLKRLPALPLPGTLVRFLQHKEGCLGEY